MQGAVQGVGFRPCVYRLATEESLAGWVINDTRGVFIELEGPRKKLERFLERLPYEKPPRSLIHSLETTWLEPAGYDRFEIRHSDAGGAKTVLVLPDIATCPDCLNEVSEVRNRRHRYPFTNCTNCGPRFTIIRSLPYDRPHTTMALFAMCPDCQAEYENPRDRRFHAQPNACPLCGPGLALYRRTAGDERLSRQGDGAGWPAVVGNWFLAAEADDALRATAHALHAGEIAAVKGLGGFHLMVDARNAQAIERLRARKPRRDKPFALMVRDLAQAETLCELPKQGKELLNSPESPVVLLQRRPEAPVAEEVAPGNPNLGVMLPYTPLHHLLMQETGFPIVATSGNLTGEPICTDEREAVQRLEPIADLFLVHNRPIERHVDDSVAWVVDGEARLLRRARGYAPLPVRVSRELPVILAVGAHLKNSVALSVGRQVFISQHIGDLATPEALAAFERVITDFLRLYEVSPVAIAHDLHPGYFSTRWVEEQQTRMNDHKPKGTVSPIVQLRPARAIPVQHHHAHLAACLAENGVEGPVLGVTWDGTGYGTDGTVWGGEFLLGDAAGFTRVAHLRTFRLPGGEAAIQEPRRVALSLLWEIYGEGVLGRDDLPPIRAFRPADAGVIARMLARGINTPLTSSMGRLFDAVAALMGLHQKVTFEGQAAMALEFAVSGTTNDAYPLDLLPRQKGDEDRGSGRPAGTSPLILDWQPLVEALLDDIRRGVNRGIMAARFHNALIEAILQVAHFVGEPKVALTGGCFQNRLLTEGAARRLRDAGFDVLLHKEVPPNDGGISLGQVAVAATQIASDVQV